MTKQEILDLISAKVAGQGDQVDAGGALGDILRGVLDLIPAAPEELTFEAPLEKTDGEVSLKYGGGLEKDDDTLAVKLAEYGVLNFDEDGGLYISGIKKVSEHQVFANEQEAQLLSKAIALIDDDGNIWPNISGAEATLDTLISGDLPDVTIVYGVFGYYQKQVGGGVQTADALIIVYDDSDKKYKIEHFGY